MEKWQSFDVKLSYYIVSGEGEYSKSFRYKLPSIIFPYNLTKIRIEFDSPTFPSLNLDTSGILIIPADTPFEVLNIDNKFDLAMLHPQPHLYDLIWANCSITKETQAELFGTTRLTKRKLWLSEIIHRYIFEKKYAGIDTNYVTRFLEIEIIKELFFCSKSDQGDDLNIFGYIHNTGKIPGRLKKALVYIEQNFQKNVTVKDICDHNDCKRSDLFRLFKKYLDSTPIRFMRERRIQEAYILLRNRNNSVNDVTEQLGINHTGHFIKHFRKKFGKTPKEFQDTIFDIVTY